MMAKYYYASLFGHLNVTMNNFNFDETVSRCKSYQYWNSTGYNVNRRKQISLLGAIGETLEREGFMSFQDKLYNSGENIINGYSIAQKRVIELAVDEINNKHLFRDSCGLACHTTSRACLVHALNEFIERQCLVHNYLSKSPGKRIPSTELSSLQINDRYLRNLEFYDISITNGYYAIIAFGLIDDHFYIGMGASLRFEQALKSCTKELDQFDYYYKLAATTQRNPPQSLQDYSDVFFTLSNSDLMDAYAYLHHKSDIFLSNSPELTYDQVLHQLYDDYEIEPILIFIGTRNESIKSIKIVERKWFPSMAPSDFDENTYLFVESKTGVKLDRNCNFIPFP